MLDKKLITRRQNDELEGDKGLSSQDGTALPKDGLHEN
jgi:hypothetical protein